MHRKGIYYLGRVVKMGMTTQELTSAIKRPTSISKRESAWTFIEVEEYGTEDEKYLFGRLCKYAPDAEIIAIDPIKHAEIIREQPNLRIAVSPFLFIPKFSGIAFLNVWNHIEYQVFTKRFAEIIKETFDNLFVDVAIEMITDLRTFAMKLSKLEKILKIDADVYPPNPLFGVLWKSLKEYLDGRNTDKMKIVEENSRDSSIKTDLPKYVEIVADKTEDIKEIIAKELPIGDAAILMAADGYGKGLVKGQQGANIVVIRTSETNRNFSFDKTPNHEELYKVVKKIFEDINDERYLNH